MMRIMFAKAFFYWFGRVTDVMLSRRFGMKYVNQSIHKMQKPQVFRGFVGAEGFEPPTLCL